MKFVIKFFPEITIKSKPVRRQFVKQLHDNLRALLSRVDEGISVVRDWDKLVVEAAGHEQHRGEIIEILSSTSGIAYFLEVSSFPLGDFDDIYEKTAAIYAPLLAGKRFVVRCKRAGRHDFSSQDAERQVGGRLLQRLDTAGVDLHHPEVTVNIEIRDDTLYVVKERFRGLGGFPMGSLDPVLSLLSGGFDSTVASYLTMKRGMRTHFCFFNLGGRAHEIGVKEVALYLWLKYGAAQRVKFIAVPFDGVVGEILSQVENSQMGVVLKRMMLRAAGELAAQLNVQALVTGESVAQVSSQTLTNLAVIDAVSDMLVLRPLITSDKTDIIAIARDIGTEEFAANMPEYCGVISVKPTTRARAEKIAAQEQRFNFALLDEAIAAARFINIDEIVAEDLSVADVEVLSVPVQGSIIIDLRHPTEEELAPLRLEGQQVMKIPFYELHGRFADLDSTRQYMLYCDRGMMSRLHASHLLESGYHNVSVYRPR